MSVKQKEGPPSRQNLQRSPAQKAVLPHKRYARQACSPHGKAHKEALHTRRKVEPPQRKPHGRIAEDDFSSRQSLVMGSAQEAVGTQLEETIADVSCSENLPGIGV
ncbi:hypothetical protein RRG08_052774 [Elysia crispata]|uniref:Uncharacterized protein n=1 Tax=Elysia crispata TaxID=231223 RepID=A0AAE1B7H8_9GAST|nr:hypothetical protein RRG08_052774 [Elysia crispata]